MLESQLKKIRMQNNLTLDELAEHCALPKSYLEEVEEGKRELSAKALDKIMNNLSLDCDFDEVHRSVLLAWVIKSGLCEKKKAGLWRAWDKVLIYQ